MSRRGWTTRFGFYLAAVGSACGLGNLWRFPYIVGENGGGAFVLLYVFLAFTVGLPILIGELLLGKIARKSVVPALQGIETREARIPFHLVGTLGVILSLVVLSYYAVVSGWVLHFLVQFVVELFGRHVVQGEISLSRLLSNGWLQMGLASVHLLVTIVIVMKGFSEGLERTVAVVMPAFALLLAGLFWQALSLPSATQALRFIFYPDFSQLTSGSLLQALGHVCFTLSVGFGVMVTFGSHLSEDVHVPTAAFRVMVLDTVLSLLSGLLIFSIALSASNVPMSDPGLLFEALPQFLLGLPGGVIFGIAFFLCLYLAALAASIGLLESVVANFMEVQGLRRARATWIAGIGALVVAVFPAVSSNFLLHFRPFGKGILEFLDSFLINWYLPPVAILIAWIFVRNANQLELRENFITAEQPETVTLFPYWIFILRWVAPGVIALGVLLQVFGVF